jgi:hypothetical protein
MSDWLKSELDSAQKTTLLEDRIKCARTCLILLSEVNSLQYETLVIEACTVIAHFGHGIFTGTVQHQSTYDFMSRSYKTPDDKPVKDCKKLFDNLSIELKYQLMHKRLKLRDNLEIHGAK